jgi:WD40 repeat protein/DNA-binding SARP family transcriptional activator
MAHLGIHLLGAFLVTLDDEPLTDFESDKARALLAYLAVASARPHRREVLAALFWPESPESTARTNLRSALANLRRLTHDHHEKPPFFNVTRQTIQFNIHSDSHVDVLDFRSAADNLIDRRGGFLGDDRDQLTHQSELETAQETIETYRGEFVSGLSIGNASNFESWVSNTRESLQRQAVRLMYLLTRHYQEIGEYESAAQMARRQVELEPFQEAAQQQLIWALTLNGQRNEAIAQYKQFHERLGHELGVAPLDETQEMYASIIAGELPSTPGIDFIVRRKPREVGASPYRGLAVFREQDAPFFFGREEFVDRIESKLHEPSQLIVVIGSSGSGKSSTVFAGLLPRLRQEGEWQIIDFRPGSRPLKSMAAALYPLISTQRNRAKRYSDLQTFTDSLYSGEKGLLDVLGDLTRDPAKAPRILLVIDQFEEVYTQCEDAFNRRQFVDTLIHAAKDHHGQGDSPFDILATLRADFMGQALAYRPFADFVNEGVIPLGPMNKAELYDAIKKPAVRQGAAFEPGLASRIMDDVGEDPGNLPLLEFALTLMWDHLDQGWLTHAAYEEIGRVNGALVRYADEVYEALDEQEQIAAQRIFVQLVQPGQGTEDTRRIAVRSEFGEDLWQLIQYLADERLVVTGRDDEGQEIVEIIHETLIKEWGRLRGWMNNMRSFRIWQEGLRTSLREWDESGRDEEALLQGVPLSNAESRLLERGEALSETERFFIQSSLRKRTEEQRTETIRQEQEERLKRRSRTFLQALVGVFLLATVVSAWLAWVARQEALEAMQAYSLSLAASARQALLEKDIPTALVLALAANDITEPPRESQRILLDAAFSPGSRKRYTVTELFPGVEGPPLSVAMRPDGKSVLIGFFDGTVVHWEIPTGREIWRSIGHRQGTYDPNRIRSYSGVNDIAWSPDGLTAVSVGDDGMVIVWEALSGNELLRFKGHSGAIQSVVVTPDGESIISGGFSGEALREPGELFQWDLVTGEEIKRFEGIPEVVVDIALSIDGQHLIASSGEVDYTGTPFQSYSLILWDVESGDILHRFEELKRDMPGVAIVPGCLEIGDILELESEISNPSADTCVPLALSGSTDHSLYLWDLETGHQIQTLEGHSGVIRHLAASPDGRRVLSGGGDGEVLMWDLTKGEMQARFAVHADAIEAIAFAPDGNTAISVSIDGTIILWDLTNAALLNRFEGHRTAVLDVTYTPGGDYFVSASGSYDPGAPLIEEESMRLWNIERGDQTGMLDWGLSDIFQLAISQDGRRVLSGHVVDQNVRLWDFATGQEIRRYEGHTMPVLSVAMTPDGRSGLSGAADGTIIHWDLESGDEIRRLIGHEGGIWALDICPDGRTALSGADDRRVIWWNLETGAVVRIFEGHDESVTGIACSPEGQRAISGDTAGWLIEWDLSSPGDASVLQGEELQRLAGHIGTGSVGRTRIAYTPDGRRVLSSGWDGTLALWDLETGTELHRFRDHDTDFLFDLSISPDGLSALSCGTDQTIIQWQLEIPSPETLQQWIETNRYVRDLTCAERTLYQLEPLCSP